VHEQVSALRVMDARGDVRIVSTPRELAMWRLSSGLHGLVTAVELELVPREKLRMSTY
jgi:FAD/FMN-containing dehydrogenase